MDTNYILAGFGFTTVVTFVGLIWYWSKRSQEVLPKIEKEIDGIKKENLEFKYKLIAVEEKTNRIEKENEISKQELQESKKKIYDSIHRMEVDIATIKNMPKQMETLVANFSTLQSEVHKFIVEYSKK